MIYWLSKILHPLGSLFDLGGHVGTKYRAWRSHLDLHDSFHWQVCDLPSIVEKGRALSTAFPQLSFTSRQRHLQDHPTLLVSGVLQYADFDLESVLRDHGDGVEHLLVNKLPTHEDEDVFTLENIHHSVVPYRIFRESRFLDGLAALGFTVADRWEVPEAAVRVPFTSLGNPVHRGYCLRRKL
jgi:putative methyltransferase (TIGR04325 family)